MRKIILMLLVAMLSMGSCLAAITDQQMLLEGKNMIKTGAPWVSDDDMMYFGTGKDVSLAYDETTDDRLEITGRTGLVGAVELAVNASTTVDTTLVETSSKVVYGVDAHSANVTLTLPDAALVAGREFMIFANADPGSYFVRVAATGGDNIGSAGGADVLASTDAICGVTVVSDGTSYGIVGAYGTWASNA